MTFEAWIQTEQTLDAAKFGEPVFSVNDMEKAYKAGQRDLQLFKDVQKELWEKCEQLTALQEKHRWRYPSKGELPPENCPVIIALITPNDVNPMHVTMGYIEFGGWYESLSCINAPTREKVLAWQYFPEPPKERVET